MAVSYSTLGDMLLRNYTKDFINEMNLSSPVMSMFEEQQFDLEKVLKEANEISFEDLLK